MDINSDEFKELVKSHLAREFHKGTMVGAQAVSRVILDKINNVMSSPGKTTYNDMKRLVKDIVVFCETGITKKVMPDGTVEDITQET